MTNISSEVLKGLLAKAKARGLNVWAPARVKLDELAPALAREVIALRAEIARKGDGLEQIQLLASNHGGWLENDPAKLVSDIHKLAGTALNNGEEPLGDKDQGI